MALSKKPVTGMKDILPQEMAIRDYLIGQIKETYGRFGFSSVETPCVERIENLSNKQGGENEKLIFKILKRGEKLNLETADSEADLVDSGLRYDLTVPLARYFANNAGQLPMPFKALQIGSVWRADRPQKGRFRQFYQCDIDILGESSSLAEIELMLATSTLLGKVGFSGFKIRVNDRKILKAMANYSGFEEAQHDTVFIILDKMDKIGIDGVAKELVESGFASEGVSKYRTLFEEMTATADPLFYLTEKLKEYIEETVMTSLKEMIESVIACAQADFEVLFDPTLVRGMSYYTGTIFEMEMSEFGSSVAGGGRYDQMIGKFTGIETPACGFSIGFERIVTILLDQGFVPPIGKAKVAYLVEKEVSADKLCTILKEAGEQRTQGVQVLVAKMNKNKKFQKEQLTKEGYQEFKEFYQNPLV